MLERKIAAEFTRVAEAIEPPAGLYPAERIRRSSPRRLSGMRVGPVTGSVLAAAVVAAALVLWPRVEAPAVPAAEPGAAWDSAFAMTGFPPAREMAPGEVIDNPRHYPDGAIFPRQRGTAYTVEQLATLGWPLPSYRGPADGHKALVVETFDTFDDNRLRSVELRLEWMVGEAAVALTLDRPAPGGSVSESPYQWMARTQDPTYGYTYVAVTMKGVSGWGVWDPKPASWVLTWRLNGTSGHLWSPELPLEELVKIAESLPSLE